MLSGEHVLRVQKPGHATVSTQVVVRTGEQTDLVLSVGPSQEGATFVPEYSVAGEWESAGA